MKFSVSTAPVLLLFICVGLVGAIVSQHNQPVLLNIQSARGAPPRAVEKFVPPVGFAMPSRELLNEMRRRPLFTPSRRRPLARKPIARVKPRHPPPPRPPPMPLRNLTLVGIALGPGKQIALVRVGNSPATIKLAEGQVINGWKVISILSEGITLSATSHVMKLGFPEKSKKPSRRIRRRRR